MNMSSDESGLNTVEVYDPASDTWATSAPMPAARFALVAAASDNLYAIGGFATGTTSLSTTEELQLVTQVYLPLLMRN
jgi:hypothetical protein